MKRLLQRFVATLTGMVAVAGIVVASPASALADGDKVYYATTEVCCQDGGDSYFYSLTNSFDLCNFRSAGLVGLYIELQDTTTGGYYPWQTHFRSPGAECNGWDFSDELEELQPLRFTVCLQTGEPGVAYGCGPWIEATA